MTYNWTTPRGSKVEMEITVNHMTTKIISLDGNEFEVPCSEWIRSINSMTINGKSTNYKTLTVYGGNDAVLVDRIGKDNAYVTLPSEVSNDIYGAEREEMNRKVSAWIEADDRYEKNYNKVIRAMDSEK